MMQEWADLVAKAPATVTALPTAERLSKN